MRIEKEYKKTGYFWLPGEEEKKIPGTLSINDGGKIELEVNGFYGIMEALNDGDDLSRIIGCIEKGGFVTLDDCICTNEQISIGGGISKSKILVNRALSGAAWEKNERVTFNTFSFSVDCLDEWVGISGAKVEDDWEGKTTKISYTLPEKITFCLNNGMKLEICFACSWPISPNFTETKITQRAYFRIKSEELRDLNDFTDTAFKITNFMCFAMDEVVVMKNLSATSLEIQEIINDKQYPVPISIYYESIPYTEKTPNKSRHEMLFNFDSIKVNGQKVFNNWLNAYEYLSPAMNLYFSTKVGAQKYLSGKFLALIQGLETYHRRTSDEILMDPKTYDLLVTEILDKCPTERVDWLRSRLKYGNDINLNKRMQRIIEPFKDHFGTNKERRNLLRKIVDTRNYLTHYDKSLQENSAEGIDIWFLCEKMEVIFNLHFLKIIGFTEEEINKVIEDCYLLRRKLKVRQYMENS